MDKKGSLLFLLLFFTQFAIGQVNEKVGKEYLLNEIKVGARSLPIDTLMFHFYKANHLSSIDDVLSRMSSIAMIRRGAYALEPSINGFSAGQIGLTIDGMRIFGACTDKMDPVSCYIEPENLDAIEIDSKSKNASSLARCIDFKLRKPNFADTSNWTGLFACDANSTAKGGAGTLGLNFQSEKLGFTSNSTYRKCGNYYDAQGNEVLFSAYEKLNFSFASSVLLAKKNKLTSTYLFDREWNVGYAALPMDVGLATAQLASLTYNTEFCNLNLHNLELKIYANSITHFMDDTQRPNVPIHMDMPSFSKTAGFCLSSEINPNDHHSLNVQLDGYANFLSAEMTMFPKMKAPMYMLTLPDNLRRATALYLADNWRLTPSLSLLANTRLEFTQTQLTTDFGKAEMEILGNGTGDERIKACLNFELGSHFAFNDKCSSSFNLHHGERLPTANEWFGFYLFVAMDAYDHIGNVLLKKEKANTFDWTINLSTRKIKLKTHFFYSFIEDYISSNPTNLSAMTIGAKGTRQFVNIQSAKILGFETDLGLNLNKDWNVLVNAKYLYGEDHQTNPLPMLLPFKILLNSRYKLKRFALTAECEAADKQTRVSSFMNEQVTNGYFLLNARLQYFLPFIAGFQMDISLACENLSNQTYREHLDWGGIYRQGRNFRTSIKLNF